MHLTKKVTSALSVVGLLLSTTALSGTFNGHPIRTTFEAWGADGSIKGVFNEQTITNSGQFNAILPTETWLINFNQNTIDLTFTAINVQNEDHQYMYTSPVGFHFEDADGSLGDITHVRLDNPNTPFGFNPALLRWDANNIYVSLQGSMCHFIAMGSMPTCTEPAAATGFNNQIRLIVDIAGQNAPAPAPAPAPIIEPTPTEIQINPFLNIDQLYTWAESTYPQYFPSQQASFQLDGYYVRHYPSMGNYLGSKDGHLYIYGNIFGGLQDLGLIDEWISQLPQ